MLQAKKVSTRFENQIGQVDKNGQVDQSGENDQKGHVHDNPSYQVTEINEFDEIGEIGQSDFFVWKIEGLSAYTLYAFRVSVILSVNFPDSVSRIDSGTSRVVRTGLSESVLSPPVFRGIHQVAKQKIMFFER